jgi:acyl dehydratase
MMTVVHYSEHLIMHRLLKPEEKISLKGKIAAIIPHRAGTHIIACVEATNKQNNPIFTEYIGGMLRGVESVGGAKGDDQIPVIPLHNGDTGPKWRETISIDPLRPYIYDGCSNISFPIHTSKQFAHQVGLPDIILQGTATLSYAVRTLINREGGDDPLKVREIACKFTGMVLPGTNIEIVLQEKLASKNGVELFFDVYNEMNKRAIRNGYIRIDE